MRAIEVAMTTCFLSVQDEVETPLADATFLSGETHIKFLLEKHILFLSSNVPLLFGTPRDRLL